MTSKNHDEVSEETAVQDDIMPTIKEDEQSKEKISGDIGNLFDGFSSRTRTLISASILWAVSVMLYVSLFCGKYECEKFGAVIVFPIVVSWFALWLYNNVISPRKHESDSAVGDEVKIEDLSRRIAALKSRALDGFFDLETKNGDIGTGHFLVAMIIIMIATWSIGFSGREYCSRYGFSIDCVQQWAGELIGYNSVGLVLSTIAWVFGVTALKADPRRRLFLRYFLIISVFECLLLWADK